MRYLILLGMLVLVPSLATAQIVAGTLGDQVMVDGDELRELEVEAVLRGDPKIRRARVNVASVGKRGKGAKVIVSFSGPNSGLRATVTDDTPAARKRIADRIRSEQARALEDRFVDRKALMARADAMVRAFFAAIAEKHPKHPALGKAAKISLVRWTASVGVYARVATADLQVWIGTGLSRPIGDPRRELFPGTQPLPALRKAKRTSWQDQLAQLGGPLKLSMYASVPREAGLVESIRGAFWGLHKGYARLDRHPPRDIGAAVACILAHKPGVPVRGAGRPMPAGGRGGGNLRLAFAFSALGTTVGSGQIPNPEARLTSDQRRKLLPALIGMLSDHNVVVNEIPSDGPRILGRHVAYRLLVALSGETLPAPDSRPMEWGRSRQALRFGPQPTPAQEFAATQKRRAAWQMWWKAVDASWDAVAAAMIKLRSPVAKVREQASRELVAIGRPARMALREAGATSALQRIEQKRVDAGTRVLQSIIVGLGQNEPKADNRLMVLRNAWQWEAFLRVAADEELRRKEVDFATHMVVVLARRDATNVAVEFGKPTVHGEQLRFDVTVKQDGSRFSKHGLHRHVVAVPRTSATVVMTLGGKVMHRSASKDDALGRFVTPNALAYARFLDVAGNFTITYAVDGEAAKVRLIGRDGAVRVEAGGLAGKVPAALLRAALRLDWWGSLTPGAQVDVNQKVVTDRVGKDTLSLWYEYPAASVYKVALGDLTITRRMLKRIDGNWFAPMSLLISRGKKPIAKLTLESAKAKQK